MTSTSLPGDPTAGPVPQPVAAESDADGPVRLRGPLRRLLFWFVPGTLGIYVVWGSIPGILLPLQIDAVDPAAKVANLAIVTTIGAFAAMLAQPVAGAISDRTRSRFGRRAPLIVGGVLVGGLALVAMGMSNGLLQLAIAWTAVQLAFNFAQGPISAIMPDRVPRAARGTFSGLIGASMMVGAIGGSVLAAQLAHTIPTAYFLIAGFSVVAITLFVVFNPDRSSRDLVPPPFRLGDFLRMFWVNPVEHPDFFWAFTGRLLLYSGYFAIIGYQLYLLQDYVGLGEGAVPLIPLLAGAGLPPLLIAIAVCGPLSDRIGRRKPFIVAAAVVVAAAEAIPWILPTFTGMLLFAIISGLGFGAFQSVDTALMSEVLPNPDDFAKDIGVVNIAATLPQTIAPAVAGVVVVVVGYAGLFPLGMVLCVLGGLAVLPVRAVR